MGFKPELLVIAALLPLGACAGSRAAPSAQAADPYTLLAQKISAGGGSLSNPRVAVLPFSYTDGRRSKDGVIVSERLLTAILNLRRLEVVERSLLDSLFSELRLQSSGAIDPETIQGLGKILGVEAVVTGTLTGRKDGTVEINARLIRTGSGEVLAAAAERAVPDWEGQGKTAAAGTRQQTPGSPAGKPAPAPPPVRAEKCPRGMAAYWNFDRLEGDKVPDALGASPALLRGPARSADGRAGPALDLSGNAYFSVPEAGDWLAGRKFSFEAWFNYRRVPPGAPGSRLFYRSGAYCFLAGPEEWDGLLLYMPTLSPDRYRSASALRPGAWYHLVFTYDGKKITLYINGRQDASHPAAGTVPPGVGPVLIGWDSAAAPGYSGPVDGLLDEIAVYRRALTPEEVGDHYKKGEAGRGYCS